MIFVPAPPLLTLTSLNLQLGLHIGIEGVHHGAGGRAAHLEALKQKRCIGYLWAESSPQLVFLLLYGLLLLGTTSTVTDFSIANSHQLLHPVQPLLGPPVEGDEGVASVDEGGDEGGAGDDRSQQLHVHGGGGVGGGSRCTLDIGTILE